MPEPGVAYATVEVTVRNTGSRTGSEVVQVYVRDAQASIDRPEHELKGFQKVRLAPGESTRVRIDLDARAFAFWTAAGWTVEPGEFTIEVGASSRDIRETATISLDVPLPPPHLDQHSSLSDWLAHPVGSTLVHTALAQLGSAESQAFMSDDVVQMVLPTRLTTLVSFAGGDADTTVSSLLAEVNDAG